jgi:hypothetical protein
VTFRHDLKLYATLQWPISYLNVLNSTRHFASMWHQNGGANPFASQFNPNKARYALWTITWRMRSAPIPTPVSMMPRS